MDRRRGRMLRLVLLLLAAVLAVAAGGDRKLQIGIKFRPDDCSTKARNGDQVAVHYTGTLVADGKVFDSSVPRGDPFEFVLGQGKVIPGWDQGLLGMCVGEVRRLVVPSELGYGTYGAPPRIPPNSDLEFEIELLDIVRAGHADL